MQPLHIAVNASFNPYIYLFRLGGLHSQTNTLCCIELSSGTAIVPHEVGGWMDGWVGVEGQFIGQCL